MSKLTLAKNHSAASAHRPMIRPEDQELTIGSDPYRLFHHRCPCPAIHPYNRPVAEDPEA